MVFVGIPQVLKVSVGISQVAHGICRNITGCSKYL